MALSFALLSVGSPVAASTPSATVALDRDGDVLWAVADVSSGVATTVKIKFLAPRRDDPAKRELWQVCKLPYSGAGQYRCGIDISPGSAARQRSGSWVVKVLLDKTLAAKLKFSL